MEKIEMFKLKKAGLSNAQVLNILRYEEIHDEELCLRDRAVISEYQKPSQLMERYHALDEEECLKEFRSFPSISIEEEDYPDELLEIYNPPALLFYQGDLSLLKGKRLAVVGSRQATAYGLAVTKKLMKEIGNQLIIVSGLAKGIDSAAHLASLKNGGKTIGVIGTGLDMVYPKENQELQEFLGKEHLLLSEYGPGQGARPYHFPERNRIIAGLSNGVLVVEARKKSGSLITCERALEEGRDVLAVPGSILSPESAGCNHLIEEGAYCVTNGQDILSILN